jgi:multidrug efflux system membrane fusion protein
MKSSYITAAAILAISTGWILTGSDASDKADINIEKPETLTKVRVDDSVAELTYAEFVVNGLTEADRKVVVKAETSGTVSDIDVEEGKIIKEGQVIATLYMDSRDLQYKQAKSLVKQMQIEFDAVNKLAEKGLTSNAKIAEATTKLEQAKASLENIEREIKDIKIKAPFEGILEKISVEQGDFVDVGNNVATVIDMDPVKIVSYISEVYVKDIMKVSSMTRGNKLDFLKTIKGKASFINGDEIDCKVSYISSSADPITRTFKIELVADNPNHVIPEGLTVELRVPFSAQKAHKLSPALLALNDKGEMGIKIVDENNIVRFHVINIIKHTPEAIWFGGLPDNIKVITVGQDFVKEGQKVIPVNSKEVTERTKKIVEGDKKSPQQPKQKVKPKPEPMPTQEKK